MIPIISDVVATPANALETVEMTMDQSAESVLIAMRSMENNYTDSSGATVREYATNALDAHVEAGVTRPIEITTPTEEKPFYIVQDFGCGMTRDFLLNNFSMYRFSTKRDDQNVNGMYGLGSKAALSEVNSFSIESVAEGYKTFARIYKTETGSNVSVLAHDKTDEPSGTRIIINVGEYKVEEYKTKISDFFYFWDPETVLVDGKRPRNILEDNYQYVEGFGYIENSSSYYYNSTLRILQGNVVYSVNNLTSDQKNKMYKSFRALKTKNVILEVPNGTLAYTDSREGIVNSSDNLAKIARRITQMYNFMYGNMKRDLNAETNPWKALNLMESYYSMFGEELVKESKYESADLQFDLSPFKVYGWTSKNHRKELRGHEYSVKPSSDFKDMLMLVADNPYEEKHLKAIRTLKSYVNEEHENFPNVYCVEEEKYNTYKDNLLFLKMVEMGKITMLDADKLLEWHKEFKSSNRIKRASNSSNAGKRVAITYPVKFHSDNNTVHPLTIEEMKNLDIKRLFFHEFSKKNQALNSIANSGFDMLSRKGDAMVVISPSRSSEVLERRLNGKYKFVSAIPHFTEKMREKYKTYSDTDRIVMRFRERNTFNKLLRVLEEKNLLSKLDSSFLKNYSKLHDNLISIEQHNRHIDRCLEWTDRKQPRELFETTTEDSVLNSKANDVCNHYGNLFFLFNCEPTYTCSGKMEIDYNELVESLNEHYTKNGDPSII